MADIYKTEWMDRLQEYPDIPYNTPDAGGLPCWTYMPAEAPPLVELRTRYGLDDLVSGMTDLPKALRLLAWVYDIIEHDGWSLNPQPCNTLNILDTCIREKRPVNCRVKAIVLNDVYLSFGYHSRYITCMPAVADGDCHVIVMVYITSLGRWITVDPTHNTYFTDSNGAIINIFQARKIYRDGALPGLRHIERQPSAPLFCNDIECSSYDEFYLLYMSKNCFRFACPVASEFGYEANEDARFNARYIYLSPRGYDPSTGNEYDRERYFSIHDGGPFLQAPPST